MTNIILDIGKMTFLLVEIRKLEDAAEVLNNEKKLLDSDPNKKVILEIACKLIWELSEKKANEVIDLIEEHGRLSRLPEASKGNEAEVSVQTEPATKDRESTTTPI